MAAIVGGVALVDSLGTILKYVLIGGVVVVVGYGIYKVFFDDSESEGSKNYTADFTGAGNGGWSFAEVAIVVGGIAFGGYWLYTEL